MLNDNTIRGRNLKKRMSNKIGKGDRFRIENETRTRQPGK